MFNLLSPLFESYYYNHRFESRNYRVLVNLVLKLEEKITYTVQNNPITLQIQLYSQ